MEQPCNLATRQSPPRDGGLPEGDLLCTAQADAPSRP